jgi:hypothetical protein
MFNWTVGVYGVLGGRGRGPWIETTRRVEGDDVSRYADPGAVVIKLVRRTQSQRRTTRGYIFSGVQVINDSVLVAHHSMMEMCMRTKGGRGRMTLALESYVYRQRLSSKSAKITNQKLKSFQGYSSRNPIRIKLEYRGFSIGPKSRFILAISPSAS